MDSLGSGQKRVSGEPLHTSQVSDGVAQKGEVSALNRSVETASPEVLLKTAEDASCGASGLRSSAGLQLTHIVDPECFIVNPATLRVDYLEGSELDVNLVCQRIAEMRKGSSAGVYENAGVIYWQHVEEQQEALARLGQKLQESPCDVVFTMERGGTMLSDFLQPYIPEEDRVDVFVSTAKDASLCPKKHISKMTDEIIKACRQGYQSIGIVEVSISGTQIYSIIRHLIDTLRKEGLDSVDLRFFILKQGLSVRPRHRKATGEKLEGLAKDNKQITVHMVQTPFLMGEDVDQHLVYGSGNQYPVNLVLPDGSLWQLRSKLGCRQTLINLIAGKYNETIEALFAEEPCHRSLAFDVKDSGSLAQVVAKPELKSRHWDGADCFWYLIHHHLNGEPGELRDRPGLLDQFRTVKKSMIQLRDWSEGWARVLHEKYKSLPQKEFMRLCQRDLEDVSMHQLRPLITSICYQLYMGRPVNMASIFRRQRKLVISILPKIDEILSGKQFSRESNGVSAVAEGARLSNIDLLTSSAEIIRTGTLVIEAPVTRQYDADVSNFLKNKCARWLDDLCACLSEDIQCYPDRTELLDRLRQLKSLLSSETLKGRPGKLALKNYATLSELLEKLEVCNELLSLEDGSESQDEKRQWLRKLLMNGKSARKPASKKAASTVKSQETVSLTGPFAGKVLQLLKCFGKSNDPEFTAKLLSSLMALRSRLVPSMGSRKETTSALYPLPGSRIETFGTKDHGTQWNAHRVCYEDGVSNIAMKGPQPGDMRDVLKMAESQEVGLFLDLINDHDRRMDKGRHRFDWGSTSMGQVVSFGDDYSLEKTGEKKVEFENTLPVKGQGRIPVSAVVRRFRMKGPSGERIIRQISFPDWPDMKPLPVDVMNELQELVAQQKAECPGQVMAVNCLAGLGRTGCFLAVEYLRNLAKRGGLSEENLLLQTLQTLVQGKLSRNHPEFVQTLGQARSVLESARACLAHQARH